MKLSYFSTGIAQATPDKDCEVSEVLSDIKGLKLATATRQLRAEKDEAKQAAMKSALPYVTWSGTFAHRKKKDPFLKHSGLLCLDFDALESVKTMKTKLTKDKFTRVCFVSPRGNGLKVVIAVPAEADNHEKYFATARDYFKQTYNVVADESGKDVSRACFLCHDGDLFYNSKSELFDSIREAPKVDKQFELSMIDTDLAEYDPVDRGDYFELSCPQCKRRDAYLYKNGWVLKCSHLNSCGFELNILERKIEQKTEMLVQTPKSKKIRHELYSLLKFTDEIERSAQFKKLAAALSVRSDAVRKDWENFMNEKAAVEFRSIEGMQFAQPAGWTVSEEGIFDIKKKQITFAPLYVTALGRSRKSSSEYVELTYMSNGSTKTKTVPKQTIAIVANLLDMSEFGVPVTSASALDVVRFLDAWVAKNRESFPSFVAVDQLGWDGDHFIFPTRIIGDTSGETIHFIESSIDASAYAQAGTLEAWVETIRELKTFPDAVVGRFLLYAGFTGLVLEPLNRRPFIVHLHGDTSTSKTTALRMIASIFGVPVEGKAMIKWHNTTNFLTRYMEKLKNVPLIIDESSGETRPIFESMIYMMEGGMGKGKALKSDPTGTAALRSFRCAVFSSGEPPVLSPDFLSGAQVRVIEFESCPWGAELQRKTYERWFSKLTSNYGHAADVFIKRFLEVRSSVDWDRSFAGDDQLSPVENRVKKFINLVSICGEIVNELFDLKFDVKKDCDRIFDTLRSTLTLKTKSAERILQDIHDFYAENQASFLEVKHDDMTNTNVAAVPKTGKVFGYLFTNSATGATDLAIIKSVFKDHMNARLKQPNGGDWAIHRLIEKQVITSSRSDKMINGKRQFFIYFADFFKPEDPF
jgi:hypothetical protein